MLQVLIILKCDDCGEFFEELRTSRRSDLDDWALRAGNLTETAGLAGWLFNARTNKHWCISCAMTMHFKERRYESQGCFEPGRVFECYEW